MYVLFTSDLRIDRRSGRNSQNAGGTAVLFTQSPDLRTFLKSCIKIPNILSLGHHFILHTLCCQSNSRLTPLPESNPSAKILRQHFILEDSHLTEWVWETEKVNGSEWMNGKQAWVRRVRQEKWYALSLLRRITQSNSSVQWQVERCILSPYLLLLFSHQPPNIQ